MAFFTIGLFLVSNQVFASSIPNQRELESLVILEGNSSQGSLIPLLPENDYFKGKGAIKNDIIELVRNKYPDHWVCQF